MTCDDGDLEVHKSACYHYLTVTSNRKVTHHNENSHTCNNVKTILFSLFSPQTHKHKLCLSLSLSLSEAPFPAWQQKPDKSVLITGESGERCHDVTSCKQIQWNKSLFVSTRWKVDRDGDHRRGCDFPSDREGERVRIGKDMHLHS